MERYLVYNTKERVTLRKDAYIVNITEYTVEQVKDPTGILTGDRFEFLLQIDVPEDDELFSENGLQLKVLYLVDEKQIRMLNYHFYDSLDNKYLEFALKEDEEKLVDEFCRAHFQEAEK